MYISILNVIYVSSTNEDLIFLGQAPIGIKNNLQKKKIIFYVRKYTLRNPIKIHW